MISTEDVQKSAAEALGRIGDLRAVGPLIDALKDKDRGVQILVEIALKSITGKDFGQDAAKWKRWWEQNKKKFLIGR